MQRQAFSPIPPSPHLPSGLAERIVHLEDPAAEDFARRCDRFPHGVVRMWFRGLLGRFLSDYDANGLLGTHDMHLLGTEAWLHLLGTAGWAPPPTAHLLDVGAGDGHVTAPLASLFHRVTVTELSRPMARRLAGRGWHVHRVDLSRRDLPEPQRFHAVGLLNVLDRTDRPLTLLARARNLVREDGCILIAAPFPLSPCVQVGAVTVDPDEPLSSPQGSWERGVTAFVRDVLEPAGLQVRALARVPYLCRGSRSRPIVALDDAVMVGVPVA